jgi:tetratricopeptide (TPR) repeat protein
VCCRCLPVPADAETGEARAKAASPLDRAQAAILARLKSGDTDGALADLDRLIQRLPFEAGPLYLRGVALAQKGDNEAAYSSLLASLRQRPDHVDSAVRAGRSLVALGRNQGAVDMFAKAVAIGPESYRAHRGMGFAYQALGKHGSALRAFRTALAIKPSDVATLIGATATLVSARKSERAVAVGRRAVEAGPERVEGWLVFGDALQLNGNFEEAEQAFLKAVELKPDNPEAQNALGRQYGNMGRYEEAMVCFRRALEIKPDMIEAKWNLSLNALRMGDYALGWETYEVRWERKEAAGHPVFKEPLWLGDEPLEGKTLLLHGEQGIGDSIQFLRYVPHVCALGGRILLGLQQRAESLHPCFPSDAEVVYNKTRIPRFDLHAPLGSLPHALRHTLGQTIPADVPYLFPQEERLKLWRHRVEEAFGPKGDRPRIGLAWSGDPTHPNDHNRSIRFTEMLAMFDGIDADLVVLQRPVREIDQADLDASRVVNLAEHSEDMHDALALTSLMDLVVSVDTSLAHTAGALGKEVWVLMPFSPDWRWLIDREDSPWYPTMRLFRQPAIRAWQPVYERIAATLRERFA